MCICHNHILNYGHSDVVKFREAEIIDGHFFDSEEQCVMEILEYAKKEEIDHVKKITINLLYLYIIFKIIKKTLFLRLITGTQ